MTILTQTLLQIKDLHQTGRFSFAEAVERIMPGADPNSIKRQIANLGKPRKVSRAARTPRTSKTRQAQKQAAATAALVSRVNEREPRVVARIERADYTAELLDNGTVRYV